MNPRTLRMLITLVVETLKRLRMKVPRLLKMAVDRLAASPIKAISLPVRPCPSNMTPKSEP